MGGVVLDPSNQPCAKGRNQHRTRTNDKDKRNRRERGTAKAKGDAKDQTKTNPNPRPLRELASIDWAPPPARGFKLSSIARKLAKNRDRAITALGLNIHNLGRVSKKRP